MKNLFVLILFVFLSACNKENSPQPETLPEKMLFQGAGVLTLPDGTEMDCDLFDEMYFSHQLDFVSMSFHHIGSVTFNPDGTCTNHWSGDDSFIGWSYWILDGEQYCNIINVKMKDDNGDIKDTMFTFTRFFDDNAQAVRFGNGDVYYFYPL